MSGRKLCKWESRRRKSGGVGQARLSHVSHFASYHFSLFESHQTSRTGTSFHFVAPHGAVADTCCRQLPSWKGLLWGACCRPAPALFSALRGPKISTHLALIPLMLHLYQYFRTPDFTLPIILTIAQGPGGRRLNKACCCACFFNCLCTCFLRSLCSKPN